MSDSGQNKPYEENTSNQGSAQPDSAKTIYPDYKQALELLAQRDSNFIFRNDNVDHAALVVEAIIKHSEREVRIFEEELCGDLLDRNVDLLNTIKAKLDTNVPVMIVFKDDLKLQLNDSCNVATLRKLSFDYGNLQVKKASQKFLSVMTREGSGYLTYVTLGDVKSFRIETSNSERKAVCSFNRPEVAAKWVSFFNQEFEGCSDYFGKEQAEA